MPHDAGKQTSLLIHVGMHKTGTTFLQSQVFPNLPGVTYVRPGAPLDYYLRLDMTKPCLISNERLAGRLWSTPEQVETSLARLSDIFPNAQVLIGFRGHAGFIVSSYKQYLHQGGILPFHEYFDATHNTGLMNRNQFLYRTRIELIEKYFMRSPFVYLQSDVKGSAPELAERIANLIGAPNPEIKASQSKVINKGVTWWQARALRQMNRLQMSEFNPHGRFRFSNKFARTLRLYPRAIAQHWLAWLPDGRFISAQEEEKIRAEYAEDWEYVVTARNRWLQ